jgi:glycosyltransferase involved in cell wall biosynthesis
MKILMLTPYLPFPPSSGGQIRSYNLIKQLSRKHEVSLFCYIRRSEEEKYIPEVKKYCKKVMVFKRRPAWNPLNILLAGLTQYPFLICIYLSNIFRKAVETELKNNKYDLIHAETFYVMTNIPETKTPILLVEQTIEYLVYKHYVEGIKNRFLKWILSIDVSKLKFWETNFWKKADLVVAVSDADKKEMLNLVPELKVDLVPNGVNLDFFKVKKNWRNAMPKILFVANFKWLQNVEAAKLLIDEVFPLIHQKNSKVKLWIVGQFVPSEITKYKSSDIVIKNLREDDQEEIRNAYYAASVFVSPLKGPGGTRLKHFGAMAAKLPLITTKVGAEGLDARDGVEIIVRDNPSNIAEAVLKILAEPELAEKIAKNARKLVEEKFSWYKMGEYLDKIYEKTGTINNNS